MLLSTVLLFFFWGCYFKMDAPNNRANVSGELSFNSEDNVSFVGSIGSFEGSIAGSNSISRAGSLESLNLGSRAGSVVSFGDSFVSSSLSRSESVVSLGTFTNGVRDNGDDSDRSGEHIESAILHERPSTINPASIEESLGSLGSISQSENLGSIEGSVVGGNSISRSESMNNISANSSILSFSQSESHLDQSFSSNLSRAQSISSLNSNTSQENARENIGQELDEERIELITQLNRVLNGSDNSFDRASFIRAIFDNLEHLELCNHSLNIRENFNNIIASCFSNNRHELINFILGEVNNYELNNEDSICLLFNNFVISSASDNNFNIDHLEKAIDLQATIDPNDENNSFIYDYCFVADTSRPEREVIRDALLNSQIFICRHGSDNLAQAIVKIMSKVNIEQFKSIFSVEGFRRLFEASFNSNGNSNISRILNGLFYFYKTEEITENTLYLLEIYPAIFSNIKVEFVELLSLEAMKDRNTLDTFNRVFHREFNVIYTFLNKILLEDEKTFNGVINYLVTKRGLKINSNFWYYLVDKHPLDPKEEENQDLLSVEFLLKRGFKNNFELISWEDIFRMDSRIKEAFRKPLKDFDFSGVYGKPKESILSFLGVNFLMRLFGRS